VRRSDYWAYWRYNREDPALRDFLAWTASYGVWDDHEVRNDFGVHDSDNERGQPLFEAGRDAFLDYNPMPEEKRMYRNVRWGKHAELFFLDTRSYRDANAAPDDSKHPKTMLGAEQRAWLESAVAASDATWKIIVTSVPLVIPTGTGPSRDGWSGLGTNTGFSKELRAIVDSFHRSHVRGLLWLSTDVHYAAVFRHTPFAKDPRFVFHEIETGPLHAGIFPKPEFDRGLLNSTRLFLHPQKWPATPTYEQARDVFNFGFLRIGANGDALVQIINSRGKSLYRLSLQP
jgi:alkaline phosphatase D